MTRHYTHVNADAARRTANALDITPEIKLTEPVNAEPDRQKLHQLADSLPIEEIQKILSIIKK